MTLDDDALAAAVERYLAALDLWRRERNPISRWRLDLAEANLRAVQAAMNQNSHNGG